MLENEKNETTKLQDLCHRRADLCELLSKEAKDPRIKSDWAGLSMEWHLLASKVAEHLMAVADFSRNLPYTFEPISVPRVEAHGKGQFLSKQQQQQPQEAPRNLYQVWRHRFFSHPNN